MRTRYTDPQGITELLEEDHAQTFQETDRLQEILINLRYEGKASWGKNVRGAREVLDFFKKELAEHMELEEEVLFPFLELHFPKLEAVIRLLESEHGNFKMNLRIFEFQLGELARESDDGYRGRLVEKLRDTGTYLICLLRSHLQVESETLYQVIDRELRGDEKKELVKRLGLREFEEGD